MSFFNTRVEFRLRKIDLAAVSSIVAASDGFYFNNSHFIRCAVLEKIRREKSGYAMCDIRQKKIMQGVEVWQK